MDYGTKENQIKRTEKGKVGSMHGFVLVKCVEKRPWWPIPFVQFRPLKEFCSERINTRYVMNKHLFSELFRGKATVTYKKPQQRKKEESEMLEEGEIISSLLILDLKDGGCKIQESKKKARRSINYMSLG